MTKHLQLSSMLDQIQSEVPDVRAAVLASRDGLAMASTIEGAESSRIAAMAATVHGVGHRVAETADLGDLVETVIRSDELTFVVYDAGTPAVLALLAQGDCNLGLVHLEGRRTAIALSELLTVPAPAATVPETDSTEAPDVEETLEASVETENSSDGAELAHEDESGDDLAPDDETQDDETGAVSVAGDFESDDELDDYTSRFAPPPPPPGAAVGSHHEETSPNGYDDSSGEQFGNHEHATS